MMGQGMGQGHGMGHMHAPGIGPGEGKRGPPPFEETQRDLKEFKYNDIKFVFPYLRKYRLFIIGAIFCNVIMSVAAVLPPLLLKNVLDVYIPALDATNVLIYGLATGIIYVVLFFASVIQNRLVTTTAQSVIHDIRESIFKKFLGYPMDFFEENKRGTLISIVTNDVNVLSDAVTMGIINLVNDIFTIILTGIIMISLDLQFGIIAVCLIPLFILLIRKFRGKVRKNFEQIRVKVAEMSSNVEENISGIRVAQSLAVEDRNIKDFNEVSQENFDLRMKSSTIFAMMSSIMSINSYIILIILIGFGGYRYIYTGLSIGIILAFVQYIANFTKPVENLNQLSNLFMEAGAALVHIRKGLELSKAMPEPENPTPLPSIIQGRIDLKNVGFTYNGKVQLFENLNLQILPHEKMGIVGETGAGKSTLINLITRLYDVQQGSVLIDDIDVRNLKHNDLRSIIGIVSQNVFLFQDTLFNNIKFGRPTATDEEVYEAARLARADQFIQTQPQGYQTKLGDQGVGVSGGQRQLIAYARLLLAHPKIAVLDEATSNIDSYTENLIQQNMNEIMKDATVLIIAHRFATLKRVDRIVVLKDGKIIAVGTHAELLESNDYYRELCEKQYSKF
jgi:ATP-binding cassette subfamily B multidrug efflux pump